MFCYFTRRLWCDEDLVPPKYQKTFCKVAPQPYAALVSSPNSKFGLELIIPEQLKLIFEKKTIHYLPLPKSTMNGLLSEINVLRTSTAFPVDEIEVVVVVVVVVVGVVVMVVVVGVEVGSRQSKSLQGQPPEQFSFKSCLIKF